MNQYMTPAALKAEARDQLLGSYSTIIGATLLVGCLSLIAGGTVSTLINDHNIPGLILSRLCIFALTIVFGVFEYGFCYMYLKLSVHQHIVASDVFFGFRGQAKKIMQITFFLALAQELLMLPSSIFSYLYRATHATGFLLLSGLSSIVFGISLLIFLLTYSMVYFILLDFPEYSWKQVMQSSAQIMDGNKGRLFILYLSFIPMLLLCVLSLGLATLWVVPYLNSAETNFYLDTMRNRNKI